MPVHPSGPIGPEHLPPPSGGPLPHQHASPHHRWLYNAEGVVRSAQAGELFARFAASIASAGTIHLGDNHVRLPEQVRTVVRHEVLPHGELVVKVELVWNGPHDAGGRSISELLV